MLQCVVVLIAQRLAGRGRTEEAVQQQEGQTAWWTVATECLSVCWCMCLRMHGNQRAYANVFEFVCAFMCPFACVCVFTHKSACVCKCLRTLMCNW